MQASGVVVIRLESLGRRVKTVLVKLMWQPGIAMLSHDIEGEQKGLLDEMKFGVAIPIASVELLDVGTE
jgi:hypothetical protein